MDLVCRLTTLGPRPVLHVSGEVDLATAPLLRDQLARAVSLHPACTITVDLDGVTALDDTGLGVLMGAAGRAREHGGDVDLVCTNERLRARLAVTGLDRAITVRNAIG
jgi:anti-sigma B factor antagonist